MTANPGSGISPFLDQDFQHVTAMINSPPKPMLLAANDDHHFIEVPFVAGRQPRVRGHEADVRKVCLFSGGFSIRNRCVYL